MLYNNAYTLWRLQREALDHPGPHGRFSIGYVPTYRPQCPKYGFIFWGRDSIMREYHLSRVPLQNPISSIWKNASTPLEIRTCQGPLKVNVNMSNMSLMILWNL